MKKISKKERLNRIAEIIERVDDCYSAMTQKEINEIYKLARGVVE